MSLLFGHSRLISFGPQPFLECHALGTLVWPLVDVLG